MQNILAIAAGKIAFGKTTIVNGIEQVGFAHAILSANAHDPFGKGKVADLIVLKLGK
jgi:dephospho-CoA kinase